MDVLGRMLVLVGGLLVAVGLLLMFSDKIPLLGKLPGDIVIKREHFQLFLPLGTSVLLSVVLSLVLWLISHFRGK
jgi:hypothetical protein